MGCKGSKQAEVVDTYGELNKNIQKTMMLRAGLNLGESSYGIQVRFSKTHKRDFTATGYERPTAETNPYQLYKRKIYNFCKLQIY